MAELTPEEEQAFDEALADELNQVRTGSVDGKVLRLSLEVSLKDPELIELITARAHKKDFSPEKHALLLSAIRKITGIASH
jgi:hypothetical protein